MNLRLGLCVVGILVLFHITGSESVIKYTPQEKDGIEKLRHSVGHLLYRDYMKEDVFLIRWLRAKSMNVLEASKMLMETIKWRKENRIDRILEEVIFTFNQPVFYTDGIDKDGSPVAAFIIGRLDVRKYVVAGRRDDLVRFTDQFMEFGEMGLRGLALNNTELDITQGTIIYDMHGYSLRSHACVSCVGVYMDWLRHYEMYYSGICKNLIFINTPRIFIPLLELLKPLMSKATRDVLKVFGPNRKEWMSYLHSFIPLDQLRHEFGGTMPE